MQTSSKYTEYLFRYEKGSLFLTERCLENSAMTVTANLIGPFDKAKNISFLGDNIENVWYTTIVAFGREYPYSLAGVECCQPVSAIAFFI